MNKSGGKEIYGKSEKEIKKWASVNFVDFHLPKSKMDSLKYLMSEVVITGILTKPMEDEKVHPVLLHYSSAQ